MKLDKTETEQERDEVSHTIYICGNDESICSGMDATLHPWEGDIANAFTRAAWDVILSAMMRVSIIPEVSRNFADWNGGKHSNQCGMKIKGDVYGYCGGLVCTDSKNPPAWLIALIDEAEGAGCDARDEAIAEQVLSNDEVDATPDDDDDCHSTNLGWV